MFFAVLGLVLSVIIYEIKRKDMLLEHPSDQFIVDIALVYNMLCTICLVISIYWRYDIWLKWSITVQRYTTYDTLINTGVWKYVVGEIIVNIVAPYPFFEGMKYREYVQAFDTEIEYEINNILLFFMFLRCYLILKFILYLTQFMNPRSQRVCSMNGCDANTMFAIKGLMK